MMIADENFAQLSLQRTFFGRSLIQRVSFAGTDLSESDLCWNDFEEVGFAHASLQGTDLRRSYFTDCSFEGADLTGARIHESQRVLLKLRRVDFGPGGRTRRRVMREQLARGIAARPRQIAEDLHHPATTRSSSGFGAKTWATIY